MLRSELFVNTNDVVLAIETFGDPADTPVVLSMGANASMVWWPESFCETLAQSGLFVVRYDHRDTGRSTTGLPGVVTYSAEDMAADLVGILDHLGVVSAHLIGMSLGGYISQIVAVSQPHRVRTLILLASEPLGAEPDSLPGIDDRFMSHFATLGDLDWTSTDDVSRFLVEIGRLCAGRPERFDEVGTRQRVAIEIERAANIASSLNHGLVTTTEDWSGATARIKQPTLVIHGALDPILPLPNGHALADLIADTRLLVLPDTGHELNPADLDDIAAAVIDFIGHNDAYELALTATTDRNASARASGSIQIDAPRERVWDALAHVENWPLIRNDISDPDAARPPAQGTAFEWNAAAGRITSRFALVERPNRLTWANTAPGLAMTCVYNFDDAAPGRTRIRCDESMNADVIALHIDDTVLAESIRTWLEGIKSFVEQHPTAEPSRPHR